MGPVIHRDFWRGRRVLVTGHTGFKGTWLTEWLRLMDAQAAGYSLPDDVRDEAQVLGVFRREQPEIVFHLAAQALVRPSYQLPLETFATNVMGTAHVLEAVRSVPSVRATVVVTSDKVYENQELPRGYRETDPLGGYDPYSSSKACAELVASAYRRSYGMMLVTGRAGNVIGGGDWALHRLVPDCVRAFQQSEPVVLRHPGASRPWQHVLEPLGGYLILAERLYEREAGVSPAYNFGPSATGVRTVAEVALQLAQLWGEGARVDYEEEGTGQGMKETTRLEISSSLARRELGWQPRLTLSAALAWTVEWYRAHYTGANTETVMHRQIESYVELMSA